ncbi:MAG: type II toxin-antitoxin system RelE family toxin [Terriglobia bacterium]
MAGASLGEPIFDAANLTATDGLFRLFAPGGSRDLKGLPPQVKERIEAAIDQLTEQPRPPKTKKLVGYDKEWRLRVGDYRILYVIDDSLQRVTIARVAIVARSIGREPLRLHISDNDACATRKKPLDSRRLFHRCATQPRLCDI